MPPFELATPPTAPHLPPVLVLAVGNPSRGDDALGPALLQWLADQGVADGGAVELLTDFQLQVEHALDLQGRRAVLLVDAAHPAPGDIAEAATTTHAHAHAHAHIQAISAQAGAGPGSHALTPQQLLAVCRQLGTTAPPAWLLALPGADFSLGADLSPCGQRSLADGGALALAWLAGAGSLS